MGPLINFEYGIDEEVWDDLTMEIHKVTGFRYETGNFDQPAGCRAYGTIGYRLDSDYLEGYRHPWEISPKFEITPERLAHIEELKRKAKRE